MTWLTFWRTTEADVIAVIAKIKAGEKIFIADVKKAVAWMDAHAGDIAADIVMITSAISGAGLVVTPTVAAAIAAANGAVAALNAYQNAMKGGQTHVTAVVQGYVAAKSAQAAVATAKAAVGK